MMRESERKKKTIIGKKRKRSRYKGKRNKERGVDKV
jgi:hypothetical protein